MTDSAMIDQFGRRVEYLRISVTDKCNLRCVYCMPMEGLPWLKREELLTYEEIARIVRAMTDMGLRRVRITGGEPLVRKDLPDLVSMISEVHEIEDLSLSTNAVPLAEKADALNQFMEQVTSISDTKGKNAAVLRAGGGAVLGFFLAAGAALLF